MPLTMRPTALASPVTRQDFTVYCGKWAMGRIYEKSAAVPPYALVLVAGVVGKPPSVHTNDHAPTLEEAKAQLIRP
jgi:hypothetical protein